MKFLKLENNTLVNISQIVYVEKSLYREESGPYEIHLTNNRVFSITEKEYQKLVDIIYS